MSVRSDPFLMLGRAIAVLVCCVFVWLIMHQMRPAPLNSSAYGCYVSDSAPPILLDAKGMKVLQEGVPLMGFHLERHKGGLVLTTHNWLDTYPADGGYLFRGGRDTGRFVPFFIMQNERISGVSDESKLNAFRIRNQDGSFLIYLDSDSRNCTVSQATTS
jgi:hypothetical protein